MVVTRQYFTSFAATFGCFMSGILFTWPSYTVELYTSPNNTYLSAPMTELEISLLGGLPSLGSIIGSLLTSPVIDYIGRRMGGIIFTLPNVFVWISILMTSSSRVILTARFIAGVFDGALILYAGIFISEIVQNNIRGRLTTAPLAGFNLGSVVSYMFGWFLTYQTIIWTNIILSVVNVIMVYLVIESPIYFIRKGREDDARASIAKYRGGTFQSISEEIIILKARVNPALELTSTKDSKEEPFKETEKETLQPNKSLQMKNDKMEKNVSALKFLFISPSSRRAFIVLFMHTILQPCMGMMSISVFAKTMFQQVAPDLSAHLCSVIFELSICSGMFTSALITDKVGRRVLLITSSTLVALIMASVGFLTQTRLAPAWVLVAMVLAYSFIFNLGAGSVPLTLLSESFVPKVQGLATMLLNECMYLAIFCNISAIPVLDRLIGVYGLFYCYASAATINAILAFVWVPETKRLSNEQIREAYLNKLKL